MRQSAAVSAAAVCVSLIGCTAPERPLPDGRAEGTEGSEMGATVSADWALHRPGRVAAAPRGPTDAAAAPFWSQRRLAGTSG